MNIVSGTEWSALVVAEKDNVSIVVDGGISSSLILVLDVVISALEALRVLLAAANYEIGISWFEFIFLVILEIGIILRKWKVNFSESDFKYTWLTRHSLT